MRRRRLSIAATERARRHRVAGAPASAGQFLRVSWFAMLSEVAIRALPRRAVLRWVMHLLCALVAIGAGAAVEAAAGARDDGVIGAPLCAQTGAAIARAAAIATPFKRCFMPLSSVWQFRSGTVRCNGLAN